MYLMFDDRINDGPQTIGKSVGNVLRLSIELCPIWFGLCFFFLCYFGDSWRFNSFQKGLVMLWSNWNGDELQNMGWRFYNPENKSYPIISPLLMYLWIQYSNGVITGIFLSIIENAYVD